MGPPNSNSAELGPVEGGEDGSIENSLNVIECVEPILCVTDSPCYCHVDVHDLHAPVSGFDEQGLESSCSKAIFQAPPSGRGIFINVYEECVTGVCDCTHSVGGFRVDLKPCRAAAFLFGGQCTLPSSMVTELWDGLCDGFRIVDDVQIPSYACKNYDSISKGKFYDEMSHVIRKELREGKIREVDTPPHCIHALGGVEKSNGRLRPITDCSSPDLISVNNFMTTTCKSFSYKSVDDVAQCLSGGEYISVTDISSAYRSVCICEDHSKYQGFTWEIDGEVKWYQENRLCFGLRSAPYIFNLLSELVVDFAKARGVCHIVNYLDDFAVVGETEEECREGQLILVNVLRHLGFSISWDKLVGPSKNVNFLGIIIDTVEMTLSLPESKLCNLLSIIEELENRGRASKKQLERLGGLVAHCSTVIKGGRTFSRRIYDLGNSCPRGRSVRLEECILADLSWWKNLCLAFNGSAKIIPRAPGATITTDSSFFGFGAWCGTDWLWGSWVPRMVPGLDVHDHRLEPPIFDVMSRNINLLELWPVLAGVKRWAPSNRDTTLNVVTDNTQVLYMLSSGRSKNKVCMGLLRELFWTCFIFNVDIFASYVCSADNVLADALSRCDSMTKKLVAIEVLHDLDMCCFHSCPV